MPALQKSTYFIIMQLMFVSNGISGIHFKITLFLSVIVLSNRMVSVQWIKLKTTTINPV
jgi:hypothetical protein